MLGYRCQKKYLILKSSVAMSQTLDHLPSDENNRVLCCYVNATSQIQVARITNISNWYFERVVFPGQRLVFESHCGGILEIHSGMMASAILSDSIPCKKLAIGKTCEQQEKSPKATTESVVKGVEVAFSRSETTSPLNIAV